MRYETLIDNGITAVIEWQHIVTDLGVKEAGRVCMSGIYAYTRGKDGRLCSTKKELRQTVSHAIDHDGYVGGWAAEEGYDFDSVRLFPEDSLSAAFDFAAANGQKAVFVLSSGEEIRLQGSGQEEFSPSTLIIMCDQAVGKDHLRTAVKEFGAEIIYDYNIICGMAIRIPEGKDLRKAMEFFAGIPGVVAVERDRIHQLID